MIKSKIEAVLPETVPSLSAHRVLVMTRLYGFKVRCNSLPNWWIIW